MHSFSRIKIYKKSLSKTYKTTSAIIPIFLSNSNNHPAYLLIVAETLLDDLSQRLLHAGLDLQHPVLHVTHGVELLAPELHLLSFTRVHARHLQVILESQLVGGNRECLI